MNDTPGRVGATVYDPAVVYGRRGGSTTVDRLSATLSTGRERDRWYERCQSFCNDRRVNTPESALGALPNPGGEFLDLIEDLASLGHLATDLAFGVHDRGVVTAERLADLG